MTETPLHADIESDVSKPGPSQPSKAGGSFGRVFSFKEYYEHKTKTDQGRQVAAKKQKKVKGGKGKELNPEVVIFIGLMQWCEEELNLKPRRGKRLALKVPRDATYKVLCEKAVDKWKAYNSNLYEEDEDYVLLPGGVLGLMFAGYVPLASQSPYPILVYFLANYRPHLSHFLENVIFAIPT